MNCIFCQIAQNAIPTKVIYADAKILAFDDLYPQAPVHKLIIPRKHIATINDITEEDKGLLSEMLLIAKKLAIQFEIAESGYRTIFNCNKDAGQEVFHIHLHLLGGRKMNWPPG